MKWLGTIFDFLLKLLGLIEVSQKNNASDAEKVKDATELPEPTPPGKKKECSNGDPVLHP